LIHISRIQLVNWIRFSLVSLELDPITYAITASYNDDPDRSNWGGKSAILESIPFAIDGGHRFRTEDEFIRNGQQQCEVKLSLSNGAIIHRRRKRGQSTQLEIHEGNDIARGDEAQLRVFEMLGIDGEDLRATCIVEQGDMAGLVRMKPEPAMSIVRGWLKLEKLERAEGYVRDDANKLSKKLAEIDVALSVERLMLTRSLGGTGDPTQEAQSIDELESDLETCIEDIDLVSKTVARAELECDKHSKASLSLDITNRKLSAKSECEQVEGLLSNIAPVSKVDVEQARNAASEALASVRLLDRDVSSRRIVALGEFDGHCPIASVECPIRTEINTGREKSARALQEARERSLVAKEAYQAAQEAANVLTGRLERRNQLSERLRTLMEQAAGWDQESASTYEPLAHEAARSALAEGRAQLQVLEVERMSIRERIERAKKAKSAIYALGVERVAIEEDLCIKREASILLGRNGAQRIVAEAALSEIEQGANSALATCGIDLSVSIKWARVNEKALATTCEACGTAFGSSTKVRQCATCGATRGPKIVHGLSVTPSDRSGAADDLAGGAVRLSAASWLRLDRDAQWSTALLDEPLAQCDKTNRRAFARGLVSLLSSLGFRQSFVTAHDDQTLNVFPGRILIEAGKEFSTARII
jgi:DNA repair exonuclease SbcCD ATPase subunit